MLAGFRERKARSVCVTRHHYLPLQSHSTLEPGGTFQIPPGWAAYLNSSSPTSLRQQG